MTLRDIFGKIYKTDFVLAIVVLLYFLLRWKMKRRNNVRIRNAFYVMFGDLLAVVVSALIALVVDGNKEYLTYSAITWAVVNVIVIAFAFYYTRHYSVVFKFISLSETINIMAIIIAVGGGNALFAFISNQRIISFYGVLVFMVCAVVTTLALLYLRKFLSVVRQDIINKRDQRTHVMIVGAGGAGVDLIKEMTVLENVKYVPACIVDDDLKKQGEYVCGVKICGTTDNIEELAKKYAIKEIFVCIPSATKKQLEKIVSKCKVTGCVVKKLPDVSDLANGQVTIDSLKAVDVKDLLGREQAKVDLNEIKGYIDGKVVLVTGGGGSIGSELCRQIANFSPKKLIILDNYENNAYEIEQELIRKHADIEILTLIANIRERDKIRDVFSKHRPQIVFHAAAHKHVPLMETSPNEAVKNNVFGTLNVARASDEFGVETFVQISTDKAVNPTNIMGATKRICEMIIQTIGKHSKTNFVAVRFGNVLGSNGSVIPLFKKQIEEGGPVTVTHKDVVRYFMTIQEAVSLVLQAGAYAKNGQIFVLDMGEQVKIYDLACNLIRLSGYEPNVDIDIVCTGLRPGEKLYEERLMEEEGLQKTANGLISVARPIALDEEKLWATLDRLYQEAYAETDHMKYSVKELVDTYTIDERF